MSNITCWTCEEESEHLAHETLTEAIQEHLEDLGVDDWPDTLTAQGYCPDVVTHASVKTLARSVLCHLLDGLDDEFGNPGKSANPEGADHTAALAFVHDVVARYTVRRCSPEGPPVQVDVAAFICENCPEWLADERVVAWCASRGCGQEESSL